MGGPGRPATIHSRLPEMPQGAIFGNDKEFKATIGIRGYGPNTWLPAYCHCQRSGSNTVGDHAQLRSTSFDPRRQCKLGRMDRISSSNTPVVVKGATMLYLVARQVADANEWIVGCHRGVIAVADGLREAVSLYSVQSVCLIDLQ